MPSVENILEPYAEKSYAKCDSISISILGWMRKRRRKSPGTDVQREMEQGFQGWEYKFNSVSSSRGDYPFITVTAGTGTGRFAKLATITMLNVRRKGQGKEGQQKAGAVPEDRIPL